jgi:hypothetical protein
VRGRARFVGSLFLQACSQARVRLSLLIDWPSTLPGDHDDVVGRSDVERIEPRSNRCSVALDAKQPRLTAMKCGSAMRLTRVKNELQHLMLNQGMQKKQKLWSAEGRARVPVRRAANRMSLSLTTPSPLLTDTFAQTTLVALSSFPCSRAADHTFSEEIRVEGPGTAQMSAIGR